MNPAKNIPVAFHYLQLNFMPEVSRCSDFLFLFLIYLEVVFYGRTNCAACPINFFV